MKSPVLLLFLGVIVCIPLASRGIYHPDCVATIIFHGIDSGGPSAEGVVGMDVQNDLVDEIAALLGKSTGMDDPSSPCQITMALYYGDTYPAYFTQEDRAEVDTITNQYGGGIPRYAAIMAKFCRHVMQRSGARQVNIIGVSMGAFVARWAIEKDYEKLASSGKIARYITIEGVVCGNWAATYAGDLISLVGGDYYMETIDIQQMNYNWFKANLHDPRTQMDNPVFADILVMHWASTNDAMYNRALTLSSVKPNDGICLYEDVYFHEVTARSGFFGQRPTLSHAYATHESIKKHSGIRAGLVAAATSTRRVRIILTDVRVTDLPEDSWQGNGEVVFGCSVFSPLAGSLYGTTDPINRIDHLGHTINPISLTEDERATINQVLFDDFVLPGEISLDLHFDVHEIDYDFIYDIFEDPLNKDQPLSSLSLAISVLEGGTYYHVSPAWDGHVTVEIIDYPAFESCQGRSGWCLY